MSTSTHPYAPIFDRLDKLEQILISIQNAPKEDYSIKYYTRLEASIITKSSIQTIDNYAEKGWIEIQKFGPKKKLIHHYQIFNEDNSIKDFRHKRTNK